MAKKIKIRGNAQNLRIDLISPNPWNPNVIDPAMLDKLRHGMEKFGFLAPLVVRKLKGKRYQVIDGEHRLRLAQELGMKEIPCYVLDKCDEAEAKRLTEIFIHLHGEPDLVKEAELIKSLIEEHDFDFASLAEDLPLDENQIESLYKSLDWDWSRFQHDSVEPVVTNPTPAASSVKEEFPPQVDIESPGPAAAQACCTLLLYDGGNQEEFRRRVEMLKSFADQYLGDVEALIEVRFAVQPASYLDEPGTD